MEPIEEDLFDASGNSNRSKNSQHQVSIAMLQPKIPQRANKTMIDELYTTRKKEKNDCIQETMFAKNEFVCSVHLHHSHNFSIEENKEDK